jgi:hypothetical protein
MLNRIRAAWQVLYGAVNELIADNGLVLASSIAFFTIFSLGPILLLVVAIAGLVFGENQTRAEIQNQFESLMGADSAQLVAGVISRAGQGASGLAALISLGTLIVGATGVFAQLKAALNQVWGVQIKPEKPRKTLMLCSSHPNSCGGCRNRRKRGRTPGAPVVRLDHSITWSARSKSDGGIFRPRALAVFRFITRSNFAGCSTGRSAGLAPLRILST